MQSYNTYRLALETFKRRIRKDTKRDKGLQKSIFGKKGIPKEISDIEILKLLVDFNPVFIKSQDFRIALYEILWKKMGKHALFINSAKDVEAIKKATYSFPEGAKIEVKMPFDSFILCLPSDCKVGSKRGGSVLVTQVPFPQMEDTLRDDFVKITGHPEMFIKSDINEYAGAIPLYMTYRPQPGQLFDPVDPYYYLGLKSTEIASVLKSKDMKEYRERTKDLKSVFALGLDEEELEYQFDLVKLIFGVAIYWSASPDSIHEGLPDGKLLNVEKFMRGMPTSKIILKGSRETPQGHFRAAHFRNLRSEKYYQNKWKSWPKGSRWTFVSESTPNMGADNKYTIKND